MAQTAITGRAASSLSASNGERAGVRCRNDWPPKGNADFAWVQHFIHHLAPHGMAGLNAVRKDLANGSMYSNQSGEGDIRRALIEADLVDCMVALPGQLFYRVVKCIMPCRVIHWTKRLIILGSFAEIRSQGAHISAFLRALIPFSQAIAAPFS
ncbi:MAG: Type restriction enzyme EcoKI protein [Verrucomicrobiota bacterium]|jgi:hypothetical protein